MPIKRGKPLSAACAGQQAEFDFRQTDFGARDGDAILAAERDFQAAAECRAMNGGDNGFYRGFHGVDRLMQTGRQRRFAEFGDVGARHESAAFAGQNANLDFRVVRQFCDAIDDGGAHADADGIDRRIVDPDDADVAALFESALHGMLQME